MALDTLIKAGTTSKIIEVMVRDSTTGGGKTGLAPGSVAAYYTREGGTSTWISLTSGLVGDPYSSGKWIEVSSTTAKGLYQLHLPNAMIAAGVAAVSLTLQATGMVDTFFRIGLPALDFFTTSMDANAVAINGVPTSSVTAVNENIGTTQPTNFSGTGSSAYVKSDAVAINSSITAAIRLALSAGTMVPGTVDTTANSPSNTVFEADDITEATTSHYINRIIIWTSGVLFGQVTTIEAYVLTGGRGHFTVTAMTEAPSNDDTFIII